MAHLCLRCRSPGHETSGCPCWQSALIEPSPDPVEEETTLSGLSDDHDQLCARCAAFNIIDVLSHADIKDELDAGEENELPRDTHSRGLPKGHHAAMENKKHHLDLGPFRQIMLQSSCPLCRLIFRIFPRKIDDDGYDSSYYLKPLRSYNRLGDRIPEVDEALRKQYAVYIAIESRDQALETRSHFLGDPQDTMVFGTEYTFALSDRNPARERPGLSARRRGAAVDFLLLRQWIRRCEEHHDAKCQVQWADELLTCMMIDVHTRKIVSCPPKAQYIALSYVWGGVSPEEGALERGTLPQTIEDAIAVTKEMGLHYLWVDALCIDQFPSPKKTQQLAMMDVIYAGAWLTIVALDGEAGDSGLRGINAKNYRVPQGREVIEGKELLQLFPAHAQEMVAAKYWTRAWTFQEFLLSHRRLMFGKHQMHFGCNIGRYAETINNFSDPEGLLEKLAKPDLEGFFFQDKALPSTDDKERLKVADAEYRSLVELYTERQMTQDTDSLNAFLGILQQLRKTVFPSGFEWGLPLHDFPQSLRWFHPRAVKPRRRPDFPSWSWTGWEGIITYSDPLLLLNEDEAWVRRYDVSTDMTAKFLTVEGKTLKLEAHIVKMDIRTEPFSEAYVFGEDTVLGSVQEGNTLHMNTLSSGTYDFLVIERLRYKPAPDRPFRQTVYMLSLDRDDESHVATRRSFVRLYLGPEVDFGVAMSRREKVGLR